MADMSFYYLGDDKIVNDWAEWDELGLLDQLNTLSTAEQQG